MHDDETSVPCAPAGAGSLTVAGFRGHKLRGNDGMFAKAVIPAEAEIRNLRHLPLMLPRLPENHVAAGSR